MKQPVGYLRKSRVTNDRDLSWATQEQHVRELAAEHGDADRLLLLSDWNRSGRKGTNGRPGYHQLVEMIEADRVSAVYSYSLSRLSRSIADFTRLAEACVQRGIPLRLAADKTLDFTTASGRFLVNVLASVAQMEAELAQERSRDTVATRRARGDRIGPSNYGESPGEDVAAIVAAYREAGSVLGAAKLLNVRRIPTRFGRPWSTTPVREILIRVGAMPLRSRPGVKAAAPFFLYRLLRCHCGRTMTGSRYRNGSDPVYTTYRCIGGRTDVEHRRQSISERLLLPWVKAEAARFRIPVTHVEVRERDERARLALEERRRRVISNFEDALIDKPERDAKILAIAEQMERMESADRLVEVPAAIDWTWPPEQVNAVLRALWERVELGLDLMPARFAWRVPEWRS